MKHWKNCNHTFCINTKNVTWNLNSSTCPNLNTHFWTVTHQTKLIAFNTSSWNWNVNHPNPLILWQNRPIRRLHRTQPLEIIHIAPIPRLLIETRIPQVLLNPFIAQTKRRKPHAVTILDYRPTPHSQIKIAPLRIVNPNLMWRHYKHTPLSLLDQNGAYYWSSINLTIPQPMNK